MWFCILRVFVFFCYFSMCLYVFFVLEGLRSSSFVFVYMFVCMFAYMFVCMFAYMSRVRLPAFREVFVSKVEIHPRRF